MQTIEISNMSFSYTKTPFITDLNFSVIKEKFLVF